MRFLRGPWFILACLAAVAIGVVLGGGWLRVAWMAVAPALPPAAVELMDKMDTRKRVMDKAEQELGPLLDQALDAFVARLAEPLKAAGLSPTQFQDESTPAYRDPQGALDVRKFRVLRGTARGAPITILVVMSSDYINPAGVERDLKVGLRVIGSLTIRTAEKQHCELLAPIVLAGTIRPADSERAQQFDRITRGDGGKPFAEGLVKACMARVQFAALLGVIQAGTNDGKTWSIGVLNSEAARLRAPAAPPKG